MPDEIDQVMYACTGSEVNDLALRVAEMHTGATGVIITTDAYHGNTAAVTAISPSIGGETALGAHVRTRPGAATCASRFADDVAAAIADLQSAGVGLSCLIVDTIFSSDGIYPDPSVLAPAVELVRRAGGVFIADEVQPGFARTGEAMWGFLRHGRGARPGHHGQADGQRSADRGDGRARRRPRRVRPRGALLQHLRRQSGDHGRGRRRCSTSSRTRSSWSTPPRSAADCATSWPGWPRDHPRIGDVRGAGLYIGVEIVSRDR